LSLESVIRRLYIIIDNIFNKHIPLAAAMQGNSEIVFRTTKSTRTNRYKSVKFLRLPVVGCGIIITRFTFPSGSSFLQLLIAMTGFTSQPQPRELK
jgi:hypothetical protein